MWGWNNTTTHAAEQQMTLVHIDNLVDNSNGGRALDDGGARSQRRHLEQHLHAHTNHTHKRGRDRRGVPGHKPQILEDEAITCKHQSNSAQSCWRESTDPATTMTTTTTTMIMTTTTTTTMIMTTTTTTEQTKRREILSALFRLLIFRACS